MRNAIAAAEARQQTSAQFTVPTTKKNVPAATERLEPPRHNRLYFVFLLALLPLGWMLIAEMFAGEVAVASALEQVDELEQEAPADEAPEFVIDPSQFDEVENVSVDEILDILLADQSMPGAHLSRKSWMHWLYALLAAAVFLGLMLVCLPLGNAKAPQLLTIGAITGTGGVIFLLGIQVLGEFAWLFPAAGHPVIMIFVWVFRLLSFAYYASSFPDAPFIILLLGFTFGVGLCEELTKALPVLFRGRDGQETDWRGTAARGFASGVGFGVAEGIYYSAYWYNGVEPFSMYLVRFASCVTLHAIWTYAAGIMIWRYRQELSEEEDWRYLILILLKVLIVPMSLHGLYNTALTKEMPLLALAAALASFGWLTLQIELVRRRERIFYDDLNRRRARAAVV